MGKQSYCGPNCDAPATPRHRQKLPPLPMLLPLGDSITDGGTAATSYRYHLLKLLNRAGHAVAWTGSLSGVYDRNHGTNVSAGLKWRTVRDWPDAAQFHEGHWGWTAQELLNGNSEQPQRASLDEWLSKPANGWSSRLPSHRAWPDVALVHLGTNDITQEVFRQGRTAHIVTQRVAAIVQKLCEANPKIVMLLAHPIPYCRFREGTTAERALRRSRRRAAEQELNRGLDRLCVDSQVHSSRERGLISDACRQATVTCIDLNVECAHLRADGVHPSVIGATRMAAAWYAALLPYLDTTTSSSR
mmetsp:Transcript_15688/g.35146  ORF Transcript_15688/g.35146 Transcript_15688/m.35146 type:complete len:302 (-) Transcript_15688:134-1039(-)|eukprot:CAMPEP_0181184140 /NCGR_PEP_ID=MMETSP1096-20121128/8804_1 /TAXON_ID=156174 ORGANISM="Chrysochromulina ericina, Strain CCMP281" /NCGR_SAMPLE_ID=MMETSP1096 /ASSEMBLY_ACC=CAM_ASM_000453 /LENGTH=301 /DNA_ID=CAMNT_0023272875 /DNA_START=261 /DNA_END=1166 /DNA_ORIENTATION=-